jgi:hypothetical protein
MKRLIVLCFVGTLSVSAYAQAPELDEKWANYMIETERMAIFKEAMNHLPEGEKSDTFRQLYKAYESELEGIRQRYIEDLKRYAEVYATMTDEQANELIAANFKRHADRAKLQKKYHKLIAKNVDGLTAARFVQLDDAISILYRLSVMDEIPFVGDM